MIWMLFIGAMALSLWAMWHVKPVYHRYNQGAVRSGLTGGEVAAQILRRTEIRDVEITVGEGTPLRPRRPDPQTAGAVPGARRPGYASRFDFESLRHRRLPRQADEDGWFKSRFAVKVSWPRAYFQ
ncbi:MAG: zinc metallopeptidase [Verrucomicrobia bacterium]|jgi:hypothetical protein|nr:zinc metallopeptidase [Verrucomicrobiota bacterium]